LKVNDKKVNTISENEKNSMIINNFMGTYNPKKDSQQQKILNYFLEEKI